jgi:hypothetical protein
MGVSAILFSLWKKLTRVRVAVVKFAGNAVGQVKATYRNYEFITTWRLTSRCFLQLQRFLTVTKTYRYLLHAGFCTFVFGNTCLLCI